MKKILISLLTYTLALLIILNCYSIMCMVYPNWIFYILTNVNFVLLLLLRRKIKLKKNASVLCAAYLLCMLLFIVRGFLAMSLCSLACFLLCSQSCILTKQMLYLIFGRSIQIS